MTDHLSQDVPGAPPPGCPAHAGHGTAGAIAMYGPDFAADPASAYARMREFGSFAPAQLAPGVDATVVTSYQMALHVLRSTELFSRDSRRWRAWNEGVVPRDSAVAGLMGHRPTTLGTDGDWHRRLRTAQESSLRRIDAEVLRAYVERSADEIIDRVGPTGRADLLVDYARQLSLRVMTLLFGCTPEQSDQLMRGMSELFDGVDTYENFNRMIRVVSQMYAERQARPGDDMLTHLLTHESALTDEELVSQIIMVFGAGTEPEQNLIANALRLLLSDDRFAGSLGGGGLPIEDAMDEVLWTDPPIANYAVHYPYHDVELEGVRLPEGDPVVISFAAATNDPALATDHRYGNRAHLAWGAGPHACPAQREARLIASVAIERLLDRIPEMELAVPVDHLAWRPGPFHRALVSLPVTFPPLRPFAEPSAGSRPRDVRVPLPAQAPAPPGDVRMPLPAAAPVPADRFGPSTGPAPVPAEEPSGATPRSHRRLGFWQRLARWWRG